MPVAAANLPYPSFSPFSSSRLIKNLPLVLTLFVTIGYAAANDGQPGKPAKKATAATRTQCTKGEKGGASCCAKEPFTAAVAIPAAPEVAKK